MTDAEHNRVRSHGEDAEIDVPTAPFDRGSVADVAAVRESGDEQKTGRGARDDVGYSDGGAEHRQMPVRFVHQQSEDAKEERDRVQESDKEESAGRYSSVSCARMGARQTSAHTMQCPMNNRLLLTLRPLPSAIACIALFRA